MKKLLLSLLLVPIFGISQTNVFNYGFDGVTADFATAGWVRTNQSTLASTTLWSIPATASTTTFSGGGQTGGGTSYALVNYTSTSSTAATGATISNWLISPSISVQNGDVVTFYTRIGKNTAAGFPDNLELRMSTNGAFTADPTAGPDDVADYTNLLIAVNPDLDLTSFTQFWTIKTATITGLTGLTDVKFAFRYFVTDGGTNGANSDLIGIDTFSVDRPDLATNTFFTQNFNIYPNPATNVVNIASKNSTTINQVQITDLNGRVIKSVAVNEVAAQINIAELNAGVYFLKVTSNNGVGITKIIKK